MFFLNVVKSPNVHLYELYEVNFVTFSVTHLWRHQAIKYVYCRVFIPVSIGVKSIKIVIIENISVCFFSEDSVVWLFVNGISYSKDS